MTENRIFTDVNDNYSYNIEVKEFKNKSLININVFDIDLEKYVHHIVLDKKTAIRFAKTLRTQINVIRFREEGYNE
jgi:hypothetical protein